QYRQPIYIPLMGHRTRSASTNACSQRREPQMFRATVRFRHASFSWLLTEDPEIATALLSSTEDAPRSRASEIGDRPHPAAPAARALGLDRQHEAFDNGIQIRTARREAQALPLRARRRTRR